MDFTPLLRGLFNRRVVAVQRYKDSSEDIQKNLLMNLLSAAANTEIGRKYDFASIKSYEEYRNRVPLNCYEDLCPYIMRMVNGEKNVLWRGAITNFAQSSGTSNGKSKYIPISKESFKECHYQGGFDVVAHYLNLNPKSRLFSGKGFILGGSFANNLELTNKNIQVGDLSANLIDNISFLTNFVRVPSKEIALMPDWEKKLPALVEASRKVNITNISGVPSWFLKVLQELMKRENVSNIHEIWPNLEVFMHGGISFEPYRELYNAICDPAKMHYIETYNASEGFFAVQDSWDTTAMLLLIDLGVFFEFIPIDESGSESPKVVPLWEVVEGETYEMIISANNGLWRYHLGDTIRIESVNPVKIKIAGRTKSFINAFGEEVMVCNTESAIASTSRKFGVGVLNYTAAPCYTSDNSKGHHEWIIEFDRIPENLTDFETELDKAIQNLNSDYEAKRYKNIFLGNLTINVARKGLFVDWLKSTGKVGGQRKVPRLSNNRDIIDVMLEMNK